MEHRRFLAHDLSLRPFAGSDLFARIGGQPTVDALIDGLYDRIDADRSLRPLFGHDLSSERAGQKRFFSEWLGASSGYSETAYLPLKHRHDLIPITPDLADTWLEHFSTSLECTVADAEARESVRSAVRAMAWALVNSQAAPAPIRLCSHGTCLRYRPAIDALTLVRHGDATRLREVLRSAPDVLTPETHAADLLHLAVRNGRTAVVELLIEAGVDVNRPSPVQPLIFVTPLCAARLKRRAEIEALLLERGAKEDVFTHAFLGDEPSLTGDLTAEPARAQACDPAADALQITPVHHAVAGGQVQALDLLLRSTHAPIVNASRALKVAAARENAALVRLLLDHGADARTIGAGRWVLHPELAPMLAGAGAGVDRSGAWIGLACTGNQGRKDDPAYVAALLRHGARVDDRRQVGQNNDGGRATALHYATRAGFLQTISLLLANGADPSARDDNGLTPLDWLERAAKTVDRGKVRQLLNARSH